MEDLFAHTRAGDKAPAFELATLDGSLFTPGSPGGKVSWICFFIITCPYCIKSLRFLQDELEGKFDREWFDLVAIGREHESGELAGFRTRYGLTINMAADPQRSVYGLFASQKVPRNYLIDRSGTIVHQSRGFRPDEYQQMIGQILPLINQSV